MSFFTGSPKGSSWQPVMTADTTTSSYWFNWRVLLNTLWLLMSLVFAAYLISKHEKLRYGQDSEQNGSRETEKDPPGILYEDEVWRPCLKNLHPGWLLGFRIFAFIVLLLMLILNTTVDGAAIFYYYTQWTFALITIYFALGSVLSMYGCFQYHNKVGGLGIQTENFDEENGAHGASKIIGSQRFDSEHGAYAVSTRMQQDDAGNSTGKSLGPIEEPPRQIAGFWGYIFQIIFQMNAGAVMLTDCIFWFILVPFLALRDYNLNFLIINMHSINAVFLLGETALNSLRFPWFRIAYFFLWTSVYVIFQWVVHACISIWWPYPFLDLENSFSPIWYLSVGLMHIPCYGLFVLIIKAKHTLMLKYFPHTYQHPR
ncbi:hypothetical protein LIER_23351 [Lithospermum erythrorhizon]|uniref:Transmembrane protein n=1 Tax=Lithospermum erythrorhizon TaxID=34254 RepID=A0AAV3QYN2_LITER